MSAKRNPCPACAVLEDKDDVLVELVAARAARKAAFSVYNSLPHTGRESLRPMTVQRTIDAAAKLVGAKERVQRAEADLSWSVTVESLVKRHLMTTSSVLILPLHACKMYRLTKRGINVAVQLVTDPRTNASTWIPLADARP